MRNVYDQTKTHEDEAWCEETRNVAGDDMVGKGGIKEGMCERSEREQKGEILVSHLEALYRAKACMHLATTTTHCHSEKLLSFRLFFKFVSYIRLG